MDYAVAPSGAGQFAFDADSSGSSGEGGGSSSSDSHSSPADSSYSAVSTHDWAVDFSALGAAAAAVAGRGPGHPAAAFTHHHHLASSSSPGATAFKLAPHHQAHPQQQQQHGMASPRDLWSPPSAHAASFAAGSSASADSPAAVPQEANGARDYFGHAAGMRNGTQDERVGMDFDDMVHEDVCGPSTLTSPTETVPTPLSAPAFTHGAPATAHNAFLPLAGASAPAPAPPLSIPIDLFAVNAGIAPGLTSAQTPSPLQSPATEYPMHDTTFSAPSTRASSVGPSRASVGGGAGTRDASLSRRSDASSSSSGGGAGAQGSMPNTATGAQAAAAKAALLNAAGNSVNLVARDAVQAAHLIPTLATPPAHAISGAELVVLGVPTVGAKSRVETQIKISLALVRPRAERGAGASVASSSLGEGGRISDEMIMVDGSLDARAADDLERIGTWSHLRLPKNLALKNKPGKQLSAAALAKRANKPEPPAEQILLVDVAVVSATDPSQAIYICQNCQARELKRSLRKKDAKGKTYTAAPPAPDPNAPPRDEEEERKKVVVFNATEIVDFSSGEVVLPTRVTCYCRHHKEKRGFCVTYTLRDHRGNVVANGSTPPIMITDDHKTNTAASKAATVASLSTVAQGGLALDEQPPAPGAQPKRKASKSGASTPAPSVARKDRRDKAASPSSGTTTPATHASGRPRRAAATRSRRGATESDDEADPAGVESVAGGAAKKARPYDADQRPARGQGRRSTASAQASRSPTFAMTPLRQASPIAAPPPPRTHSTGVMTPQTMEGASLPPLPQQGDQQQLAAAGLALGLGGMEDALMADSPAQQQQANGLVSYLADGARGSISSEAGGQIDWRANLSTPPMSPGGSTAPSESYHSLFSGFPSPAGSLREVGPATSSSTPGSAIPSFAIPATEPIPTSLTPSWIIPQQPEQLHPPAPPPRITRLIPGEGPVHGGIEVTVLGENFVQDLTCVFGDAAAVPTHFWSANTLVCVLPPSANPGPVVVGIKGVPLTVEQGTGLQLFTYKDDSDRSLLELALQVVGLKMTGRLEDAAAVAMRIVGNSPNGAGASAAAHGGMLSASTTPGSQHASGVPTDTAALAATLNAAATSVYATPATSRASSRRSSFSGAGSPSTAMVPLPATAFSGETRGFEGIVIKFLSLLDLDPSLIPGAAPSLPSSRPPISLANAQQHTLLHLATVLGFHRLVAFLLARGVTLDKQDRNGYTALHFAALYGRVNIARQLLDAGADARPLTRAAKSALEIAQDRDDVDVEELLLARGAVASPAVSAAALATPTAAAGALQLASPAASVARLSDEDEAAATEYASDWTIEADSDDSASDSDLDDDDEHDAWDDSEAQDADESALDETSPVRRPRVPCSRQVSRNASTVSLYNLVETEQREAAEYKRSPRFRRASLANDDDDVPAGEPLASQARPPVTPLNHLASASSSWLSQKLKPTVPHGLSKLQPALAGGVTGAWEKAKANRFGVPTMHMPELTAFHAMPAALTRHMSSGSGPSKSQRRRAATVGEARSPATSRADVDETDLGDEADESSAPLERLTLRDWRAAFQAPAWWSTKTPSSPPPSYSARDELSAPAPGASDDKSALELEAEASSSTAVATSPRVGMATRLRARRRPSAASHNSDETEADAESDAGSTFSAAESPLQVGIRSDGMLLVFWLPVLCVALYFAWTRWATQVQPVLDTFFDTVLPHTLRG